MNIFNWAGIAVTAIVMLQSAQAQQKPIKEQIVGTWKTLSVSIEANDGHKIDPFAGGKLNGHVIFTADGHYALIHVNSKTPKIASGDLHKLTPKEAEAVVTGSYAVYGTYTVNEAKHSYTLHILASTFPNEIGRSQTRQISFSGNRMIWRNPLPPSHGKAATVTNERVGPGG